MNSYKMPLCGVNLWDLKSERLLFFYLQSGRSHTVTELQSCEVHSAEKSQNVCALPTTCQSLIKPISINTINSKAARLYFHTVLNQHGHSSALTLSIHTSSQQVFGELLLSVSPVAHFYCNQHWSAASSTTPKVHLHPLFYVHIVLFTPFEERNLW